MEASQTKTTQPRSATVPKAQEEKLKWLPKIEAIKDKVNLKEFLHGVIDELCGRDRDWKKDFGDRAAAAAPLIDAYRIFFIKVVGLEWKKPDIEQNLKSLGVKDEETAIITECALIRYLEIRQSLIRHASTICKTHLKDFDWRLELVMGSDKASGTRRPLLRLSLVLAKDDGTTQDVLLELPKEDLDKLLTSLQTANKAVQKLRV